MIFLTLYTVKYCVHRKTKQSYAIKIIDMENIRHKNMEAQLRREIAIMKIVRHKHIINLHEVLQLDDGDICIVMELATGGELFDRIGNFVFFLNSKQNSFCAQIYRTSCA